MQNRLPRRLTSTLLVALVPTLSAFSANTWVVDDDGGPGVDFTTVVAAVAAADHGDTIWIHPGFYPEAVSGEKGVTLTRAAGLADIDGPVTWHDLGASRQLRIRGLSFEELILEDCAGAVFVDDAQVGWGGYLRATRCDDLRLSHCLLSGSASYAATFIDSDAEVVSCHVEGDSGYMGGFCDGGGPGAHGMLVAGSSNVVLARTTVIGGAGGDTISQCGDYGGDGGNALVIAAGSFVQITGQASDEIRGGRAGEGPIGGDDGIGGDGVLNSGTLRFSGVTIAGGESEDYLDGQALVNSGSLIEPLEPDPILVATGVPTPGGVVQLTVHAPVGSYVRMLLGRNPERVLTGLVGPLLVDPIRTVPVGHVPASGSLTYHFSLPGNLPIDSLVIAQARVTGTSESFHTHSVQMFIE